MVRASGNFDFIGIGKPKTRRTTRAPIGHQAVTKHGNFACSMTLGTSFEQLALAFTVR
jgi:hypothetical protein